MGSEANEVHDTSLHHNMECDVGIREDMRANVALPSYTTTFPQTGERMTKELTALALSTMEIKFVAPPEQKHSVSTGG